MLRKNIFIGSDAAGFALKEEVKAHLSALGYEVTDCGTDSEASCHYPDYALPVCENLQKQPKDSCFGILICGTGIGMSIAANKHVGIRAACCSEAFSAELTRRHNDANVLCFGARVIDLPKALELTKIFVSTEYEGLQGGRHKQRLDKIAAIEKNSLNK